MKLFPRESEFDGTFARIAKEENIPVAVLKGFAALESAFNPDAERYEAHIKDSSYGLLQVLYSTAKSLGYKGRPEDLKKPYFSILYGAKFLNGLKKKYPKLSDMVAAYNMGFPRKISQTTQFIANIYKYPISYKTAAPSGWIYANQPYVDRVTAYIAYYEARESKNDKLAQDILDAIKKKIFPQYLKQVTPPPLWVWLS